MSPQPLIAGGTRAEVAGRNDPLSGGCESSIGRYATGSTYWLDVAQGTVVLGSWTISYENEKHKSDVAFGDRKACRSPSFS